MSNCGDKFYVCNAKIRPDKLGFILHKYLYNKMYFLLSHQDRILLFNWTVLHIARLQAFFIFGSMTKLQFEKN